MKVNRMHPRTRDELEELRSLKRKGEKLSKEDSERLIRLNDWDNLLKKRRIQREEKFYSREFRREIKDA